MSRGIGAFAKLVDNSDKGFMYAYAPYDLNTDFDSYKEAQADMDGIILIAREFFSEPIIEIKRKRRPSGKKLQIEKRIYPEIDYYKMLQNGSIRIENSKRVFHKNSESIDLMAIRIVHKLNHEYVETGEIPQETSVHI